MKTVLMSFAFLLWLFPVPAEAVTEGGFKGENGETELRERIREGDGLTPAGAGDVVSSQSDVLTSTANRDTVRTGSDATYRPPVTYQNDVMTSTANGPFEVETGDARIETGSDFLSANNTVNEEV